MSPRAVVERAVELGLDLIALSDHNCALNLPALETVCRRQNLACLFGIEACTREEAHILLFFETCAQAQEMGEFIYRLLPEIPNIPEVTGDQVWVDADELILGEAEKLLISGADISLEDLLREVRRRGGLFIPAHIDRPVFSIPSQLGFLPNLDYDALESTVLPCPVPQYGLPVIQNSDAHYIEDIGKRWTAYEMEAPGFKGLKKALRKGRA
jgi:PHP family Zn ribbon phosphoesterase